MWSMTSARRRRRAALVQRAQHVVDEHRADWRCRAFPQRAGWRSAWQQANLAAFLDSLGDDE